MLEGRGLDLHATFIIATSTILGKLYFNKQVLLTHKRSTQVQRLIRMCLRLEDKRYCLSYLTILGVLQTIIALPIIVLSFLVFFLSGLGAALSPFWCGLLLLGAGLVAILIRPTRLACVIFFHVLLNAFSLCSCVLAALMTGLYGSAVQLPEYDAFESLRLTTDNSTCIFDQDSPLYTVEIRDSLRPVDSLVASCADLSTYWTYLIGLMSLTFVGMVISVVAIISNCVVPCAEDRYEKTDVDV